TDEHDQPLSFPAAARLLEAIRADYDRNPRGFRVSRWSRKACKGYRLEDAGKRWIEHLVETRSEDYPRHQKRHLDTIRERIGNMDVREIRAGVVDDLYRGLSKDYKPKTVESKLKCLRALLGWMKRREELDSVPAFPEVKVPERTVHWLTREEQARAVAEIPAPFALIVRVGIETGVRPGEAVALDAGDVQEGGVVICKALTRRKMVKETKRGKIQFKRVSPELYADLIAAAKDKLPGAPLFLMADGTRVSAPRVSYHWRKARAAAGVDASLNEGTRHSFATRLRAEKEAEMGRELAREMGHGNVATTIKHYAPRVPRMSPGEKS
ncbi:MAG: tyrosine-type recombinase/integrase, partial [Deltaproteobacteria bacterium]|nr:tyrosine-type recombinase/integrase [Deltaproteobacteria bacterium]